MIDFFKSRQFLMAITIGLLLGMFARYYGNKQFERGFQNGKQAVAKEIEKWKLEEWARREKEIAAAEATMELRIKDLHAATADVARQRASIQKTFIADLERVRNEREKDYRTAAAVPDNRVWSDIRDLSIELSRNP